MSVSIQNKVQIGQNATAANNFVWERDATTGVLVLRRGTHDVVGSEILKVNADGGVNLNNPAFSAYSSAQQSIAHNTHTKVTFDVEEFDSHGLFASSRFTPNVAGYYLITGALLFTAVSATAIVLSYIAKGNATTAATQVRRGQACPANASINNSVTTGLVYLDGVSDYVELWAYHNVGAANNLLNSVNVTYFQGHLVRAA